MTSSSGGASRRFLPRKAFHCARFARVADKLVAQPLRPFGGQRRSSALERGSDGIAQAFGIDQALALWFNRIL